ncbi:ribonuclease R [bacterium SCSIO 12741]|nr:ribonuclease R [bacterium SCSIO 12741]
MGRKKKKQKSGADKSIGNYILSIFHDTPNKPYNYRQMARRISLNTKKGKSIVQHNLEKLAQQGMLVEIQPGQYKLNYVTQVVEGLIDMTSKGSAYVIVEGMEKDVYVPNRRIGKALNGDRVKVEVSKEGKSKLVGTVLEVVERKKTVFVGTMEITDRFAFMIADDDKMPVDIFIPKSKFNGAKNGQKVIVQMTDWPEKASSPFGRVEKVLGYPGDNEAEMNSILVEYGFPLDFPEHVKLQAAQIPMEIPKSEIEKREDFREVTTFTIDPVDAKDFDDALSFRSLENGNVEVGVHIADVTHYVRPGTELEKEAVERATSVYLVDRVIPMLPEELSNVVCSLRPNEDKLTYACIFEMNDQAEVVNYRIKRTVIHSDRRFTYEEVQEILEGKKGDYEEELHKLNDLAKVLREKRIKKGSIAFDKVEVRFQLDEEKKPEGVFLKVQKDAHKLIEEFMLLANQTVSKSVNGGQTKKAFVYRVHDNPDPEKLAVFSEFIRKFGYNYKFSSGNVASNMNQLLNEIQGKREESILENLAIRTMAKAEYSTDNIGHYGLHFQYYSHFTSPIRRYPDMMVHRLLEYYETNSKSANEDELEQLCKHSSEMEQRATNAERDSVKFFQVLYMQDTEGKEFTGAVSGISEWGIYVELENSLCEGMIRLRELDDDYYYFDEANFRVLGHNSKSEINLGDKLVIRVKSADLSRRRLDFELVEKLEQ